MLQGNTPLSYLILLASLHANLSYGLSPLQLPNRTDEYPLLHPIVNSSASDRSNTSTLDQRPPALALNVTDLQIVCFSKATPVDASACEDAIEQIPNTNVPILASNGSFLRLPARHMSCKSMTISHG